MSDETHLPSPLHDQTAPSTNGGSRVITVHPFAAERRARSKTAFTARRVPPFAMQTLVSGAVRPRTGDLVLARVDRLRQHSRLELPSGRKASLHVGDEIIIAYADRYATDQFEAHVPPDLGPTNLVASGGVASRMLSRSSEVLNATEITPIGLIGGERGTPLNVADFALQPVTPSRERPRTISVIGTAMNAGKTTTICSLVQGLSRADCLPGTTKVTGTGSGGDYWVMIDAGACMTLDFTDVGLASTYRIPMNVLERKMAELVDHLTAAGCGVILVEIADGLFQQETSRLIQSDAFRSYIDGVLFAAGDAMGAAAGVARLQALEIEVIGVSGRLTGSPLATREAAAACGVPAYTKDELRNPAFAPWIAGLSPPATPGETHFSQNASSSVGVSAATETSGVEAS
ncbi:MAG: DUF1611 domain-containing protein [Gemmatimonadetes bacterium]|nr:DUF1611 domain-containing protein [Gemmatimonadota bacterium]